MKILMNNNNIQNYENNNLIQYIKNNKKII